MLSQQDIFVQITQEEMLQIEKNQRLIAKNQFVLNGSLVNAILTDSHIFLSHFDSSNQWFSLQVNFSVKFDVIRAEWEVISSQIQNQRIPGKPLGISLQKQNSQQKIELFSNSVETVNLWTKYLEKKINQRSFHKLFKAKRKIGKGAFATVYLAQSLVEQKMVAVKAFSKEKQYAGDKGRESLENEIKIMRILNHENVMKLEGVYETQNSIYLILQYLQGLQLNDVIKNRQSFTLEESREILKGLIQGISHLASKRIIHRDLKPQNIMFRKRDSFDLTICDFGLATIADEEKYLFVRCGTPGFVAPEIINMKDLTMKSEPISDVFSAGIIFHYLLLKKSVFEGTRYSDILAQNRACNFDFTKEEYTKIDPQAFDLLKKMLQKTPESRITAQEAVNHPFLSGKIEEKMQVQGQKYITPLKEKDTQPVDTPSTLKSDYSKMNLRKRVLNPLTRQLSYKQSGDDLPKLKKSASNASKKTRSTRSQKSKFVDEMQEQQ